MSLLIFKLSSRELIQYADSWAPFLEILSWYGQGQGTVFTVAPYPSRFCDTGRLGDRPSKIARSQMRTHTQSPAYSQGLWFLPWGSISAFLAST